ncbi:MAG TPA: hypothetical protein VIF62_05555 [Labilithrix sp.]
MQATRIVVVAFVALAACGVEAIDFSQKTCPCPSGLDCDTSTNRCVPAGTVQPTSLETCVPKTCEALNVFCGSTNDGCGNALDCGGCAAPEQCVSGACKCVAAATCADAMVECGTAPNGCGANLACPACPGDKPNCGGGGPNKCGTGTCTPKAACDPGQCGSISDGCSGTITCPACPGSQTCGGGGVANVCGCQPKTCSQLGLVCTHGTDNCGNPITCSSGCTGGKVCNLSMNACVCATCGGQYGWQCGSGSDGCGGTLSCAACSFGTCQGNHRCDD